MPSFEAPSGLNTHYEVVPGAAPATTLFMHGNLAGNLWWEPTVEKLRERFGNARLPGDLILAEWRGCGRSAGPRSDADLEMDALAADHLGLLDHLGVARANVVAHSTGGLIALAALRAAPERLTRAVLLDPVSPRGLKFGPEMVAAFARMREDREFCATVMAGTIQGVDVSTPLFRRIVDTAFGTDRGVSEGLPRVLARTDLRPILGEIRQPVLVLHGDRDPVLPIAGSEELAAALPAGSFRALVGHGHSCNVEDPALFAGIVATFLYG